MILEVPGPEHDPDGPRIIDVTPEDPPALPPAGRPNPNER